MPKKSAKNSKGFSIVEAVVALLVVTVIVGGALYVWKTTRKNSDSKGNKTTQANTSTKTADSDVPSDWTWYESPVMGLKVAYPKQWTVGEPRTIATAAGEQGWTVTVQPTSPQNGDPSFNLSTYPATATIKDVDAGPHDVKVQGITTADKTTFTLVGVIEDPSKVTKPTQMYASTCWPRNCTPKLANAKYLDLVIGSTNNDCTRGMLCPTEINQSGAHYGIMVEILESISAL